MTAARRRPEQSLHLQVAAFLRVALRPPTHWFTLDHGAGKVSVAAASLLKARGGKRGLPDILVLHPQPLGHALGCIVVGVELKASAGRLSPDQVETHEAMTFAGARVGVCRSVDDVAELLVRHGVPLHARVMTGGRGMKVAA